jgi:hypothetical protein
VQGWCSTLHQDFPDTYAKNPLLVHLVQDFSGYPPSKFLGNTHQRYMFARNCVVKTYAGGWGRKPAPSAPAYHPHWFFRIDKPSHVLKSGANHLHHFAPLVQRSAPTKDEGKV